jgi:hypothetical protein
MQFVCLSSSPVSLRSLRQPFFYWRRHLSVIPPLSVLILSYRGSSSTLQRRRLYIPIGNPILSYPILYQRHASHRPTPLFIVGIFFFIFFCFASVILSLFLLLGFDLSFFFPDYFLSCSPRFTWNHLASTTDSRSCALRELYGKRYR